jgi:hypothetical protein
MHNETSTPGVWENILNFIMSNYNELIELLNINEKYLEKLAISWLKALFVIII